MSTMTEKPKTEAAPDDAGPAPKKKRKLLLVVLPLVVVLSAGAAYEFVLPHKKPVASAAKSATKPAAKPAPKPGPLVATDAVTINLAGGHYLRVSLGLQFTAKVSKTAPPDPSAAVDQTISYFTGQPADRLETQAGLVAAKAELTTRIAGVYPKEPLMEVLFTSFVVQ